MQTRGTLHVALLLVLYSFSSADNATADQNTANFCYWTSNSTQGRSHYSFLRLSEKTQPKSLHLYHSIWTEKRQLVDCVVNDDPTVTGNYLYRCRGEPAGNFFSAPDKRFNINVLFAPDSPCSGSLVTGVEVIKREKRDLQVHHATQGEHSSGVKLKRKKRAWIVPGTVWCGSGNKATHYDDLGVFGQTDMCCREHDHCKDTIAAFKFGYGIFNRHFFTVSHCDCDHRFRKCLLAANDTISNMVGYSYFNILKTPCFIFTQKMQCTKTNWWGMCTLSQMTQFAVIQNPTVYNSSNPETDDEDLGVTSVPSVTVGNSSVTSEPLAPTVTSVWNGTTSTRKDSRPPGRRPKPRRRCRPRGLVRDNTFRIGKVRGMRRRVCVEQPTIAPTQRPPTPSVSQLATVSTAGREDSISLPGQTGHPGSENALPALQPMIQGAVPDNRLVPMEDTRQRDKLQPCDCYKHLDECSLKILPQEERFGLRNMEHKTLYHCNCTHRMAQQLSELKEPDAVQSLLVDYVSLSCFKMPNPHECSGRTRCSAILAEASHLRMALMRSGDAGARHPEGQNPKVKRHNTGRSKRKLVPVRLYKRCLRIMDSKTAKLDKTAMP